MKTTLIVFAVLLFLLVLLSSFGGSIRTNEPFYNAVPAVTSVAPPSQPPSMMPPSQPPSMTPPMTPPSMTPPMTPPVTPPSSMPPSMTPPAQPPSMTPPPSTMSPPSMPPQQDEKPKISLTPKAEMYMNFEKFEVPEPFTNPDDVVGAPF